MGIFRFKRFSVDDSGCAMKVGTDGVLLGAWSSAVNSGSIIDIGAGTGLVALMMAQRYDSVPVVGIELDRSAYDDALSNVDHSPWSDRVHMICADAMTWDAEEYRMPNGERLPRPWCIVSNPPFFTESLRSPDASRALARHGEGLCVESLIALSGRMMAGNDTLSFIAPTGQDDGIQYALALHRLAPVRITDVVMRRGRKPSRSLYEVKCDTYVAGRCARDTLTIRDIKGDYTPEYIYLTNQFYLHL